MCIIAVSCLVMVQIIAKDQEEDSFLSTATVTINIKDTNDNSPMFPNVSYKLKVSEHSTVGTVVGTITVSPLFGVGSLRFTQSECGRQVVHEYKHLVLSFTFQRLKTTTRWIRATLYTHFSQTPCMFSRRYAFLLRRTTENTISVSDCPILMLCRVRVRFM